jgi:hypothetical protein
MEKDMSDVPSPVFPNWQTQMTVEVMPAEGEDDDLGTIAIANLITTDLQQEAMSLEEFDVKVLRSEEHERGVDIILLITLYAIPHCQDKNRPTVRVNSAIQQMDVHHD